MKQILNKTNLKQIKLSSTYSRIKDLSEKHIGEKINIKVLLSSYFKSFFITLTIFLLF